MMHRWLCCRIVRSCLYNYFKQMFAQVTNPPIDAIREEIVTSPATTIGPERNLLNPEPESCRQIRLDTPVLSNEDFAKIRHIVARLPLHDDSNFFTAVGRGRRTSQSDGFALRSCRSCHRKGHNILILSDRGVDAENAAIPALLAVAGLHHHLIRQGTRTKVSIMLESAEPRDSSPLCVAAGIRCKCDEPLSGL